MKKKLFILLMMAITTMSLAACGNSNEMPVENSNVQEEAPEGAFMYNPMVEQTEESFMEEIGIELVVPDGATNVQYFTYSDSGLGEMLFELNGLDFVVRIQVCDEFTDISGLYYEWTVEDSAKIGYSEGKLYRYIGDEGMVDLCAWYDAVPGIMYSISTESFDLDGFDITAIANQVYSPAQGNN